MSDKLTPVLQLGVTAYQEGDFDQHDLAVYFCAAINVLRALGVAQEKYANILAKFLGIAEELDQQLSQFGISQ